MSIDRERERGERGGSGGDREKNRESKFRKKQGERGGFNPEEGRKEGKMEILKEREKKVMQGKLKFLAYELFLSNQGK